MNPQFEQSQGLRLPQPSEIGSAQGVERPPTTTERGNSPHNPSAVPASNPLYAQPQTSVPQNDATTQAVATATAAAANDDNDNPNVDLEWINKAKQIVSQTRADPFRQSGELSKFKADYLKTRHHVTIKVAEDNHK